jgi:ADP-ribosylglycohydrolase
MVFTTQALLRSRANIDFFARLLRRRLAFYQWSRPFFYIYHQVDRLVRAGTGSGLNCSLGNDPLPRSAILSAVLQGHSHGGLRWVHRSTVSTHPDTMVAHAAMLVSVAVQGAQLTGSEFEISRDELISLLYRTTTIPDLQERLKALASLLSEDGSLEAAAELLGFSQAANPCLVDSALLGIYAWLRYRGNYRRSVEEVSMLGGDTVSAAVVAGSLAGAELGVDAIPKDWLAQTAMQPYDRVWRERFIERLRDWPHGPEDIQRTRTLPSMPVRQVLRNLRYAWWWGTLPVRRIVSG